MYVTVPSSDGVSEISPVPLLPFVPVHAIVEPGVSVTGVKLKLSPSHISPTSGVPSTASIKLSSIVNGGPTQLVGPVGITV